MDGSTYFCQPREKHFILLCVAVNVKPKVVQLPEAEGRCRSYTVDNGDQDIEAASRVNPSE